MYKNRYFGGWSQTLSQPPLKEFNTMMYGMVTNLPELTTGTKANPGWSPENSVKPEYPDYRGKTLWTYGGGGAVPSDQPASTQEVERIVSTTIKNRWDGIDFDDESNMNISYLTQAMSSLKNYQKATSYGFIAGYCYNHPKTVNDEKLTIKVKQIIDSGYCDRLVHYCYAASMWSMDDIINNVRPGLEKSIHYGMPKEKIVLALTTTGLTDEKLNYFLESIVNMQLGGLFVWNYHKLTPGRIKVITDKLALTEQAL